MQIDLRTTTGLAALILIMSGCAGGAPSDALVMPDLGGTPQEGQIVSQGSALGELPAQRLELGACGTFFWTMGEPRRFIVFENESEGVAQVYANGATHGFYAPARGRGYVTGDVYQRTYVDPARDLEFRLSATMGEATASGMAIERAVLRHVQPNGQTVVTPLQGIYACRTDSN